MLGCSSNNPFGPEAADLVIQTMEKQALYLTEKEFNNTSLKAAFAALIEKR